MTATARDRMTGHWVRTVVARLLLAVPMTLTVLTLVALPADGATGLTPALHIGTATSTTTSPTTSTTVAQSSAANSGSTANPIYGILAPVLLPVCDATLVVIFALPEIEPSLKAVANKAIPILQPLVTLCAELPQPTTSVTCPLDSSLQSVVDKLESSLGLSALGLQLGPEQEAIGEVQAIVDTMPAADQNPAVTKLMMQALQCTAAASASPAPAGSSGSGAAGSTSPASAPTPAPTGSAQPVTTPALSPSSYAQGVQDLESEAQAVLPSTGVSTAPTTSTPTTTTPAARSAKRVAAPAVANTSYKGFRYPEVWLVPLALLAGIFILGRALIGGDDADVAETTSDSDSAG